MSADEESGGDEQTDVLGGEAHGRQDQQHGDQSGTRNAGCSHAGQRGRHAAMRKENRIKDM